MVPEDFVEGCSSENDLREASCGFNGAIESNAEAGVGDTVQGLAPPLVTGDTESGNSGCSVNELRKLLVDGESRDDVSGSVSDGEFGVAECVEWVGGGVARVRRPS